jgi:hypothetical protein
VAAADTIDWTVSPPASGEIDGDEVRIDERGVHQLITIIDPAIEGDSYMMAGTVRFEGVTELGYLEMWSYFGDGGAYYSRTLADEGPMAALSGESGARRFELPFALNGSPPPERIEVNLVLPASGTVWIGPMELVGFGDEDAWWSETQSGLIGAAGGILAGLMGASLGILGARRSRRRLTLNILVGGIIVGGLLAALCFVALVIGQPRHVWYPLGLIGLILVVVDGLLLPRIRAATAAEELQRIRALDA